MKLRSTISVLAILVTGITSGAVNAAETHGDSTGVLSHIPRAPVASSAIDEVGYSRGRRILEVKFRDGSVYRYLAVPRMVYQNMLNAPSKAKFFNYNVRGHYKTMRVRPRMKDQLARH